MHKQIHIIVESNNQNDKLTNIIEYISTTYNISSKVYLLSEALESKELDIVYLLYLNDNDIKNFFLLHINTDVKIGILPNDNCPMCMQNYGMIIRQNDYFFLINI